MPIYEYRCKGCGDVFEMFRLFSERDARIECPRCGRENPERLISPFFGTSAGASGNSADSCSTRSYR